MYVRVYANVCECMRHAFRRCRRVKRAGRVYVPVVACGAILGACRALRGKTLAGRYKGCEGLLRGCGMMAIKKAVHANSLAKKPLRVAGAVVWVVVVLQAPSAPARTSAEAQAAMVCLFMGAPFDVASRVARRCSVAYRTAGRGTSLGRRGVRSSVAGGLPLTRPVTRAKM